MFAQFSSMKVLFVGFIACVLVSCTKSSEGSSTAKDVSVSATLSTETRSNVVYYKVIANISEPIKDSCFVVYRWYFDNGSGGISDSLTGSTVIVPGLTQYSQPTVTKPDRTLNSFKIKNAFTHSGSYNFNY